MLPPTVTEEPVIAARDQLRPVLERHPIGPLRRFPMREHLRRDVAAVPTPHRRPVDALPDLDLRKLLRPSVSHQDRGVTGRAVHTRMGATSIRIDRPLEREEVARDAVDDRLRFDLDALDPTELWRVERSSRDLEELLAGHGHPG